MAPPDLVIYGLRGSPFVRKVEVVLAEKDIPFDFEMASPFPPPDWFVEMNPARRIPVLRDRSIGSEGAEGTIPDSSAICLYIERKHPDPALYPGDAFAFGRALWLEEYADSVLAGHVGLGMFRPMVMGKLMGKERDPETARKTLSEKLPEVFDYFEKVLGTDEHFVGGALSIADIAIATQFVNFVFAGGRLDATRWPALEAWLQRMHQRPSFAACIETERKFLPLPDEVL